MLKVAIGRYPHTAGLIEAGAPGLDLVFESVSPISRAFAPVVRSGAYDVSEMAIATFLQARAWGKPLVLLPVVLAARFQESALLCRVDGPVKRPEDLIGRRVGVRAYSQTTGMWLRGTLAERHGVAPEAMRWVTFEEAHVAEYRDPAFVERAPAGADMLAMLQAGELDAAIFGNDTPSGPTLRTVFPDPAAAGEAFRAAHGFVPVNHLVVVKPAVAAMPGVAAALHRAFGPAATTRANLAPALGLAVAHGVAQGLLPRALSPEEIWQGLPPGVG
jgi:4,5-dihydroxyphthalate decarboxylase